MDNITVALEEAFEEWSENEHNLEAARRFDELTRELKELDRIRQNKQSYALRLQWWLDREREQIQRIERMRAEQ